MQILITGAGGFIANNIADWLQHNSDHEIIGIYRNKKPLSQSFPCICCDLYREPEVLKKLQFDVVIHFASQLYGDNMRDFLDNTVQATRNILDIAKSKGVKSFIYISTISVCGETKGIINEQTERINLNDYELTKWIGERLLEDTEFEKKTIIRLPRVLGKGIDYSAPWLPKISYHIMKGKDVSYYNPDLKYNALIHTDDLSRFINYILHNSTDISGTYVLGSEKEMTILEILEFLKEEFHSKSELIEVETKGENRCHSVDISKVKNTGFKPDTVKHVLEKYIDDMKGDK